MSNLRLLTRNTKGPAMPAHRLPILLLCLLLLGLSPSAGQAGDATGATTSTAACDFVVTHANRGELPRILLGSDPPGAAEPAGMSGIVFRKRVDINNDGRPERVFIRQLREARGIETFEVYDAQQDRKIRIGLSRDDRWHSYHLLSAMNLVLIEHGGRVYMLGKTGDSLHYLALIEPSNEMRLVCEFGQRADGPAKIKTSKNDEVCRAALEGRVRFVDFTLPHSITEKSLQEGEYWRAEPGKKAAQIDLDNDGKKEVVIPLLPKTGLVRGADAAYLAVLKENGTQVDGEATWRVPRRTGSRVLPFVMGGVTYLDERQVGPQREHWQIYMLSKDILKTVCVFEVHPVNHVMDDLQLIERYARPGHHWGYAISSRGTGDVEALIRAGQDVNEREEATDLRPLHMALHQERYDLVRLLLKAGADPFRGGNRMFSPLWGAVHADSKEQVTMLLQGAKQIEGKGCDELNAALYSASPDMLELLLRSGIAICDEAAVNAVVMQNRDNKEKLRILLAHGLEPNRLYTKSVLAGGVHREASGAVKVGPDIQFKKVTRTLNQWAKTAGDPEVIKILNERGSGGKR